MPLYQIGPRGLRVLRADHTFIDYPPGQVVAFARLPEMYEGDVHEVKADPKKGVYENKVRPSKEDKVPAPVAAPGLLEMTQEDAEDGRPQPPSRHE